MAARNRTGAPARLKTPPERNTVETKSVSIIFNYKVLLTLRMFVNLFAANIMD